jgi:hypothetical protein
MSRRLFWHNVVANLVAAAIVFLAALAYRSVFRRPPPDVI